jgi:eukaryotic-like serine/threonine-protein kinase
MNGKLEHVRSAGAQTGSLVWVARIREQLDRILASGPFLNSRRPCQFLRYVVHSKLAGEEDGIKEYLIGIEAFERPADYDPKVDPIVRIEAGRLRKKLAEYYAGPGADDPIVIELPKGGYVPVFHERPARPQPAMIQPPTDAPPAPQQVREQASSAASSKSWKMVAAAAVLLAVLIGGWRYYRSLQARRLTEKDTIVLTDFTNTTGDAVFDDALKTALTVSLRQSPFLNVLSDSKVANTLKLMTRQPDAKLTPELARDLCQRTGSKAYIAGAIASLGTDYVLQLKAINCRTGDPLAREQATAPAKQKVLDALGHAASQLRGELGESLSTVQRFDVPLAEATTSSLEALKAFSLGRKALYERGEAAALPYHQRAIELDPRFAVAYRAVGADYFGMGELARAAEYYTQAFQLREHASELEKMYITTAYYGTVTGELDKTAESYQEEIQSYPHHPAYTGLGNVYCELGQYEKAEQAYREYLNLFPETEIAYGNFAYSLLALQRFDEARQTLLQAQMRKLDDFVSREALYALAFLTGNSSAMAEQLQWFTGRPEENNALSLASDTEAYVGHLHKSRDLTRRSVASAIRADSKETAAIWLENSALREAAFGQPKAARQSAAEGLKLASSSSGASAEAALAFAVAGDVARAKSLAEDLNHRKPLDTQMQSLWLPAIHAQLALGHGNPEEALNILKTSAKIELGLIPFAANISCLYPTYIRGQAYLSAGQGSDAAAEFRKIIDHSGIVWNCWTGALAHLGVARANAIQATNLRGAEADAARVRALAAYKDFLTIWKDADPDIPIYKAAKAEYARLL